MQLLVTGATGKVGVNLIERLLSDLRWRVARVRALCHSRSIAETDRIEVVKGRIEDRHCTFWHFSARLNADSRSIERNSCAHTRPIGCALVAHFSMRALRSA